MTVIAIEGRAGSGVVDVARVVARELDLDFGDRLLLAEIARWVGATVEAVQDSTLRLPGRGERIIGLVQRMLERSSVGGAGSDPYFGPGVDTLIARPYAEMNDSPMTSGQELDEKHFIQTTAEVIRDVAEAGQRRNSQPRRCGDTPGPPRRPEGRTRRQPLGPRPQNPDPAPV
jgi:hypothetical protein